MVKKTIILLLLASTFVFGQAIYRTKTLYPFVNPNDSLLAAGNLTSANLYIGDFLGAANFGIQFDTLASGGSVAKAIDVYSKFIDSGLGWGVPFDSTSVDSIILGQIDSTSVMTRTIYFDLANYSWWGWFEYMQIILDPATGLDSLIVNEETKVIGQ